jgi:hypothetical protein
MLIEAKYFLLSQDLLSEEASKGAATNSQGVAFEAAMSKELHHKKQFAEQHPNEEGMSAAEAHKHHMNNLSHEMQGNIAAGAKKAAEALREHLHEHGIFDKNEKLTTTWTSKPGQLSKTVGVEDKDNPSDIVLSSKDKTKHIGASLKFGDKPGLRSPGVKDLSKLASIPHFQNEIDAHKEELAKDMGRYGKGETQTERHNAYRQSEKSNNPKELAAVAKVKAKSLAFRATMASRYAAGLSKLSHDKATDAVRRLMNAEETKTHYIKVSHNPKNGKTHISDPVQEFKDINSKVKKYHFSGHGMYTDIHAEDKQGELHHIARIGIKDKSSPMTNIVGSVQPVTSGYSKILNK